MKKTCYSSRNLCTALSVALVCIWPLTYCLEDEDSLFNVFRRQLPLEKKYGAFSESERLEMLDESKKMFYHGYDNYMKHAFPQDELNPLDCAGRGPDHEHPENININDVLGDYSLTLVDSLDMLAIMGNVTEFQRAVKLVIDNVHFDKSNVVQVFEVTIRMLGGLLSSHLLMEDPNFPELAPDWYMDDLLSLAHDLAERLLPAFDKTDTGIPLPRVNLKLGVPDDGRTTTCTAGAGSLLLEFSLLSRLLGDPIYEIVARRAAKSLFTRRHEDTGLLGNVLDVHTGEWSGKMSGLGAGIDSYFEILLKSFIMFGESEDSEMFHSSYDSIKNHLRRGRLSCNSGFGLHPLYVNVEMSTGKTSTHWIDSLQAAFPGVQVLAGDVDEAICHHAIYYSMWRKYGCLPERYNWQLEAPDVKFYPLRPELIESTYILYRATKNPFYLHVGRDILTSLNNYTRSKCGYATVHDVLDKSLEDRQESFFLSETVKYLYLLFDFSNPINVNDMNYVFSTEGHILPLTDHLAFKSWDDDGLFSFQNVEEIDIYNNATPVPPSTSVHQQFCDNITPETRYSLPLRNRYLQQVFAAFGL